MSQNDRVYDIVLHGATGYTGKFAREYISQSLPTNLVWAVAGRSEEKLSALVKELQRLYPDRKQPAIEVVQLKRDELHILTKKTKVLLNTVGPYALYGEPVVEACASNGTHYFDVTGESPYTKDMIDKYNDVAKSTKAIIIPQIGVESTPSDVLTYAMVKTLHRETSQTSRESIVTLHSVKGAASGGTLATVFNIFETYTLKQILSAAKPGSMSALPTAAIPKSGGLQTALLGVRAVPDLGTLVKSIQASADEPLVHRSWSLYRTSAAQCKEQADAYGADFSFSCYMNARNIFTGVLMNLALALSSVFLLIPPVRWMLAKLVTQAGSGATEKEYEHDFLEYRGLAIPNSQNHQRAFGKFRFDGSAYHVTAIFMVEAAATLLYDGDDVPARKMQGGLLTPATLGDAYIERLRRAGVLVETRMLRN